MSGRFQKNVEGLLLRVGEATEAILVIGLCLEESNVDHCSEETLTNRWPAAFSRKPLNWSPIMNQLEVIHSMDFVGSLSQILIRTDHHKTFYISYTEFTNSCNNITLNYIYILQLIFPMSPGYQPVRVWKPSEWQITSVHDTHTISAKTVPQRQIHSYIKPIIQHMRL